MSLLQSLPLLIGGVTEPPLHIGLAATFLGALSGSIFSGERKFPITGVLAIAIAAGLGGGVLRDLLSHEKPELVKPGPINYAAAMLGSILYV
ncbi:MAG TPA: TRIC cation channel family protein, partial [Thermoleophilia bacterium]|nr:TRIC cation channel family protein [Thermoleophilia bacterium]